jgi:hypothetical protein
MVVMLSKWEAIWRDHMRMKFLPLPTFDDVKLDIANRWTDMDCSRLDPYEPLKTWNNDIATAGKIEVDTTSVRVGEKGS